MAGGTPVRLIRQPSLLADQMHRGAGGAEIPRVRAQSMLTRGRFADFDRMLIADLNGFCGQRGEVELGGRLRRLVVDGPGWPPGIAIAAVFIAISVAAVVYRTAVCRVTI